MREWGRDDDDNDDDDDDDDDAGDAGDDDDVQLDGTRNVGGRPNLLKAHQGPMV